MIQNELNDLERLNSLIVQTVIFRVYFLKVMCKKRTIFLQVPLQLLEEQSMMYLNLVRDHHFLVKLI
jgi:hypothetical protein